jgi:GTP:adenosylcobinamide-phosphate guanylyltransferase
MATVVLAGGRGTRIGEAGTEKPLLAVRGIPLLRRVVEAWQASGESELYVATSPHTPRTEAYARAAGWSVLETRGRGYAEDVAEIATRFPRYVTCSADLPYLPPEALRNFLRTTSEVRGNWVGLLPESCAFPGRGASEVWPEDVPPAGRCRVVGINVVEGTLPASSLPYLFENPWVGVNVNTLEELTWANSHAPGIEFPRSVPGR